MAVTNTQAPRGFVPVAHFDGSAWNGQARTYCIPSTDGSQYRVGDLVKTANGCDTNGIPNVQKAAAGNTCRGVIVGIYDFAPEGTSLVSTTLPIYVPIPATKAAAYYVMVADSPDLIMEAQDDGTTYPGAGTVTANQQAATNYNINFVVTNPSDSNTPWSSSTVGASTAATTNTLPLKLMGKKRSRDVAFGTAYVTWLVAFNLHELSVTGTTGV